MNITDPNQIRALYEGTESRASNDGCTARRVQNMWSDSNKDNKMKDKILPKSEEAKDIMALARLHNKTDLGHKALASDMDLEEFRNLLRSAETTEPINMKSPQGGFEQKGFSLTRVIESAVEGKALDGLEGEFHQECVNQFGNKRSNAFYIPNMMSRVFDDSAPLISTYVQNVEPSIKQAGLYQRLGVRTVNVNDGIMKFPREDSFPASSMIKFDGSNAITPSDPTLSSVSLVGDRSVACFVELARDLAIQNSVDAQEYLQGALVRSVARTLDDQLIGGSGSGANLTGILNTSGINSETYSGSIAEADVRNAIKALQDDGVPMNGAVFVLNPAEAVSLASIDLGTDTGKYLYEPDYSSVNGDDGKILGVPAFVSDQISSGNMVLGHFQYQLLGMHSAMQIEIDPYHDFAKGNIGLRLFADVSSAVVQPNAFCKIVSA